MGGADDFFLVGEIAGVALAAVTAGRASGDAGRTGAGGRLVVAAEAGRASGSI